jgi:hypothetical protein
MSTPCVGALIGVVFLSACAVLQVLAQQAAPASRLKVFLDCASCYAEFLRTEVGFVDFVRDRQEAAVHVLVTTADTGSGGLEHTFSFIGQDRFTGTDHTLKTATTSADTEDIVRRQLACGWGCSPM